ncbi:hypothetical protein BAUCODRAFT_559202 [Baudoinia panamericana UAMH 10762]|uniref:Uncharacterized protein n=1 Tax=Baudoinia panamericana (strain UAMH 10762) TaxID=717646 RepID=M2N6R2_BAUPA|nr:uncharacterized protein BAUCODRAFT_559202 [Baudoinia panamericana UAMH 10762]EMC94764.1 hypothetical protein BAUCODRAFT_559202 [Baudoinia panamericana UAMH 10762]
MHDTCMRERGTRCTLSPRRVSYPNTNPCQRTFTLALPRSGTSNRMLPGYKAPPSSSADTVWSREAHNSAVSYRKYTSALQAGVLP